MMMMMMEMLCWSTKSNTVGISGWMQHEKKQGKLNLLLVILIVQLRTCSSVHSLGVVILWFILRHRGNITHFKDPVACAKKEKLTSKAGTQYDFLLTFSIGTKDGHHAM